MKKIIFSLLVSACCLAVQAQSSMIFQGYHQAGSLFYFSGKSTTRFANPLYSSQTGVQTSYLIGKSGLGVSSRMGYGFYQAYTARDTRNLTFGDFVPLRENMHAIECGTEFTYSPIFKLNAPSFTDKAQVRPYFAVGCMTSWILGGTAEYQYMDANAFDGNANADVRQSLGFSAGSSILSGRLEAGIHIRKGSFLIAPLMSVQLGARLGGISTQKSGTLSMMGGIKFGWIKSMSCGVKKAE